MSGETVYHPLLKAMFGCPNLVAKRHLETAARILRGCAGVQAELARKRPQRLRRLDGEIAEPERRIGTLVEASGSGLPKLVRRRRRLLERPGGRRARRGRHASARQAERETPDALPTAEPERRPDGAPTRASDEPRALPPPSGARRARHRAAQDRASSRPIPLARPCVVPSSSGRSPARRTTSDGSTGTASR